MGSELAQMIHMFMMRLHEWGILPPMTMGM